MSRSTSTEEQQPAADGMLSWFGFGLSTGWAPANSRFRKSAPGSSTAYWSRAPNALAGMNGWMRPFLAKRPFWTLGALRYRPAAGRETAPLPSGRRPRHGVEDDVMVSKCHLGGHRRFRRPAAAGASASGAGRSRSRASGSNAGSAGEFEQVGEDPENHRVGLSRWP